MKLEARVIDRKGSEKWSSMEAIPVAPSNVPLILKKSLKGESSEGSSVAPINALIWQPLEATGRYWARHRFSSQPGSSATTCCARLIRSTFSELYPRSNQTPPNTGVGEVVNKSTGAQAQASSQIIEASVIAGARTESGSGWANYSSGSQVPVTRYVSAAAGTNKVTYTITGISRIHWRHFQASNGGKITVSITESGIEITAAQYLVGPQSGARYVNQQYLSSTFDATRFGHAPLAKGLDPAKTYVVTLTWASGLGARIYDSGLIGFVDATQDRDGFPFNTVGVYGLWDRYTSFTGMEACMMSGSRVVYQTASCTRIDWNYGKRTGACYAGVRIYDSSGTEIPSGNYRNLTVHANGDRFIDTYGSTTTTTVTIADGLSPGIYYVHIWALPDRSVAFTEIASSGYIGSQWAIYDGGLSTYNTAIGGTVGVDSFIDSVKQFTGGGSDPLDGAGNFIFAGQVRDSGDPNINSLTEVGFVTGTHGAESYPASIVVKVDGITVDWSGSPDQTEWTGDSFEFSFTTQIGTQSNPTNYFANASYVYTFDRFGITTSVSIVTTRDIYAGTWFVGMNIAPNNTATNGTLLGTGFDKLLIDPGVTLAVASSGGGSSNNSTRPHYGTVFYSPEGYAIAMVQMDPGNAWAEWDGVENATLNTERSRTAKTYAIARNDSTGGAAGELVASGHSISCKTRIRMLFDSRIPAILNN